MVLPVKFSSKLAKSFPSRQGKDLMDIDRLIHLDRITENKPGGII